VKLDDDDRLALLALSIPVIFWVGLALIGYVAHIL
jgi:hypothetical protein